MKELARVRRFLGLSQRDLSLGTSIPIHKISGAETGRAQLSRPEEQVLRTFLEDRIRLLLQNWGKEEREPAIALLSGEGDD